MKIHVTDLNGKEHTLDAPEGWRVMEIVRDHGLTMKAECGGACACATCHAYVDETWLGKIPPMSGEEDLMLDDAFHRRENSRLSCQIIMTKELDGLRVFLAANTD